MQYSLKFSKKKESKIMDLNSEPDGSAVGSVSCFWSLNRGKKKNKHQATEIS